MLEPPTSELQQRLRDWRLCRPADLRHARRRVRQLTRELPAFDSVWIDALVQDGCLTPYQARVLESDRPESLIVGEYVLLDELGRSRGSRTCLARSLSNGQTAVIKQVATSPERRAELLARGRKLAAASSSRPATDLVSPASCWDDPTGCCFAMPHVAGTPLSELLVRRGRFPAEIVTEVGRQLAESLAEWHRAGQVHGDIRLSHVRITSRGQAVLVEAGLRPVIEPDITLYASLSLEAYDGVAPELIGVGCQPSAAADLYALGCLLWQLLAGRPPFPTADPLAKLAAHQTKTLGEIRDWAPETPVALAELIAELTNRDPMQRPQSADDVARRLQQMGTPGRSAIRAFRRQFDGAVPHLRPRAVSSLPWMAVAVALFLLGGFAASLTDRNVRRELLSLAGRSPAADPQSTAPTIDAASGLLPLPRPTAGGVVTLDRPGPYAVAALRHAGPLRIHAANGVCPVILVRHQPLELAAERVMIEGVAIRHDVLWLVRERPEAMLRVQAQQLNIVGAEFDLGVPARDRLRIPVAVALRSIDDRDPTVGELNLEQSVFRGAGTGLRAESVVRKMTATDVLWQGQEAAFEFPTNKPDTAISLTVEHCTLRNSRGFACIRCEDATIAQPLLAVTATDCVFGLTGSLLQLVGDDNPVVGPNTVVWNGDGNLIPPELAIATWRGPGAGPLTSLPTDDWPLEGLMAGRFAFAGTSAESVADAVLAEAEAPRRSPEPPGVRLARFPACRGGIAEPPPSLPPGTFNRGP